MRSLNTTLDLVHQSVDTELSKSKKNLDKSNLPNNSIAYVI